MNSWQSRTLLLAGVALFAALPAASQESPESLLPPGFSDPEALPPPIENASRPPAPTPSELPSIEQSNTLAEVELDPLDAPRPSNYFSIPEGRARPTDVIGILTPGNHGLAENAFGTANGGWLASLMRQLDAPLPSRWTSILLRRALLSRLAAPGGIAEVDWVAERADLLLRMGEADAARMLVQSVDQENFSPRMIEVAGRTALATADPAALCPIVGPARARSGDAVWIMAEAMCAALEGEAARAAQLLDEARRVGASGIDLMLAEKVVGAGPEARRAASVDWEGVGVLNPWRFGLAAATGTEIPASLMAGATPAIRAWRARAPMLPLEQRLEASGFAASLGIFSSRSLVDVHSLMLDMTDPSELAGTPGALLRTAWSASAVGDRLEAMRSLWRDDQAPGGRYARLILTAGAASRIAASADQQADAGPLIASMLAAGLDRRAARWAGIADAVGGEGWALLALAAPRPAVDTGAARVEDYLEADDSVGRRRGQLLVAGLIGLGRVSESDAASLARAAGIDLRRSDSWCEAIDQAARMRQPGTVALLAAVGMQTGEWGGVPPHYFYRIVRALRSAGMDYEARMIAAEAMSRL